MLRRGRGFVAGADRGPRDPRDSSSDEEIPVRGGFTRNGQFPNRGGRGYRHGGFRPPNGNRNNNTRLGRLPVMPATPAARPAARVGGQASFSRERNHHLVAAPDERYLDELERLIKEHNRDFDYYSHAEVEDPSNAQSRTQAGIDTSGLITIGHDNIRNEPGLAWGKSSRCRSVYTHFLPRDLSFYSQNPPNNNWLGGNTNDLLKTNYARWANGRLAIASRGNDVSVALVGVSRSTSITSFCTQMNPAKPLDPCKLLCIGCQQRFVVDGHVISSASLGKIMLYHMSRSDPTHSDDPSFRRAALARLNNDPSRLGAVKVSDLASITGQSCTLLITAGTSLSSRFLELITSWAREYTGLEGGNRFDITRCTLELSEYRGRKTHRKLTMINRGRYPQEVQPPYRGLNVTGAIEFDWSDLELCQLWELCGVISRYVLHHAHRVPECVLTQRRDEVGSQLTGADDYVQIYSMHTHNAVARVFQEAPEFERTLEEYIGDITPRAVGVATNGDGDRLHAAYYAFCERSLGLRMQYNSSWNVTAWLRDVRMETAEALEREDKHRLIGVVYCVKELCGYRSLSEALDVCESRLPTLNKEKRERLKKALKNTKNQRLIDHSTVSWDWRQPQTLRGTNERNLSYQADGFARAFAWIVGDGTSDSGGPCVRVEGTDENGHYSYWFDAYDAHGQDHPELDPYLRRHPATRRPGGQA